MERFTILRVILAQGPCYSSLYRSNFSICTAEASTVSLVKLGGVAKTGWFRHVVRGNLSQAVVSGPDGNGTCLLEEKIPPRPGIEPGPST